MYYAFVPIALTFSRLSFDLGVISLLFLARSSKAFEEDGKNWLPSINPQSFFNNPEKELSRAKKLMNQKRQFKHMKVRLSTCQFLKLFCNLYNPF